jgi:hypothetical protein
MKWGEMSGVLCYNRISMRLKGKFYSSIKEETEVNKICL